jgi:LacI family transcriptional regulator
MSMGKQLTLEAIGKMAGVSRATVSRVINNYPHISPEVRERVQRVIDETGYRPNLAARTLASSRSHIIGMLIPYFVEDAFTDPYYPELAQGVTEICYAHDYTLSLFLLHAYEDDRTLERILGTGFVDGLIITLDPNVGQLAQLLDRGGVPFVHVGRPPIEDSINYVDVDNVGGAYTAVKHLIQQGYERIAFIGRGINTTCEDRLAGYRQALADYDRPWIDELVVDGDFTITRGYEAMNELLPLHPDAVFAVNDRSAIGALDALNDAGLRVPEDVALVGFDDIAPAQRTNPSLSTIRQPIRQCGTAAAEILLDILSTGAHPVRRQILPTELVIRHSCGALRDPA